MAEEETTDEEITLEDALISICMRAQEDEENFCADTVKTQLEAVGFGHLWEQAEENLRIIEEEDEEPDTDEDDAEPSALDE